MIIWDALISQPRADHLIVAKYIVIVLSLFFFPYIAILFGSLLYALGLNIKGRADHNPLEIRLSSDIVTTVGGGLGRGFFLGILPLMVIGVAFAQILYDSDFKVVLHFGTILVLATLGIIFSFFARNYALEIDAKEKLFRITATLAILFLFLTIYGFVATTSLMYYPGKWAAVKTGLPHLFSAIVFVRLLWALTFSLGLTAVALLFFFFIWGEGLDFDSEDYKRFTRYFVAGNAFLFTLLQPLFVVWDLYIFPEIGKTAAVYNLSAGFVLVLMLCGIFLYQVIIKQNERLGRAVFPLYIVGALLFFLSDHAGRETAYQEHTNYLLTQAEQLKQQQALEVAPTAEETVSKMELGKQIYNIRCAACHAFDRKVVGPPHFEVLPKYVDKKEDLVKFILNPVRVNPEYPPMPSLGLQPHEAEAVTEYLMEEYLRQKQAAGQQ